MCNYSYKNYIKSVFSLTLWHKILVIMLQYIIESDNSHKATEIAECALAGGCKWIRLNLSNMSQEDAELCIKHVQDLCKHHECILSIENDVEAAKQWQVDGVHLTAKASMSPVEARKQLGEEPIMGITINDASQVPFLPRTAVDYIEVEGEKDLNSYIEVVKQMKLAGLEEPVVAKLSNASKLHEILSTGINGIALNHYPIKTNEFQDIITTLNNIVQTRLT